MEVYIEIYPKGENKNITNWNTEVVIHVNNYLQYIFTY